MIKRCHVHIVLFTAITALIGQSVMAAQITGLKTFTAGTPAVASDVNDNFTAVSGAVNTNDTRLTNVENTNGGLRKMKLILCVGVPSVAVLVIWGSRLYENVDPLFLLSIAALVIAILPRLARSETRH